MHEVIISTDRMCTAAMKASCPGASPATLHTLTDVKRGNIGQESDWKYAFFILNQNPKVITE
jgi:hypothetical protein